MKGYKKFAGTASIFLVALFLAQMVNINQASAIRRKKPPAGLNAYENSVTVLPDGTWCHTFNTNLRKGDATSEVIALQIALEDDLTGYPLLTVEPGFFGTSTMKAVVAFQEKYRTEVLSPGGLMVGNGIVRGYTRAKLNQLYGCSSTTESSKVAVSLTVSLDPSSPVAKTVVMGAVGNNLAVFRLANGSSKEGVKVTDITVTDVLSPAGGMAGFQNVGLYNGITLLSSANASSVAGDRFGYSFHFASPLTLPKSGSVSLTLKGDASPYLPGASNVQAHTFSVNSGAVTAFGAVSNSPAVQIGTVTGSAITIQRSVLSLTSFTSIGSVGSRPISSADSVANLTWYASGADSTLGDTTINFSGISMDDGLTQFVVDLIDPMTGIRLGSSISGLCTPVNGSCSVNLNPNYIISAGTTKTARLRINSTGFIVSPVTALTISLSGAVPLTFYYGGSGPIATSAPTITSLSPSSGPVGTEIFINGANFTPTNNTVYFGTHNFGSTRGSDNGGTRLLVEIPSVWSDGTVSAPGLYRVAVSNANGISSDIGFTVTMSSTTPPQPSMTVLSPNGGESLSVGTTYDIKYSYTGVASTLPETGFNLFKGTTKLGYIFPINGAPSPAGQVYSARWTVGQYYVSAGVTKMADPGSDYYIGLYTPGHSDVDRSNAPFSIIPQVSTPLPPSVSGPSITITSPNGGETWLMNRLQNITWTSKNLPVQMDAYLTFSDGCLCRLGSGPVSLGSMTVVIGNNQSCPGISRTVTAGSYRISLYANNGDTTVDFVAKSTSNAPFNLVVPMPGAAIDSNSEIANALNSIQAALNQLTHLIGR